MKGDLIMIDVKAEFSARGDGIVDDYFAISRALATVSPGGSIYFPPGKYNLYDNQIIMPLKKIALVGSSWREGAGSEITSRAMQTIDTEAIKHGRNDSAGSQIRGLDITNTATNGTAVRIRNGGLDLIESVFHAKGYTSIGIECRQSYNAKWDHIIVSGTAYGIECLPMGVDNPAEQEGEEGLNNNTFISVTVLGEVPFTLWAIWMLPVTLPSIMRNNTFIGLDIENCQNGINLKGENNVLIGANIEVDGPPGLNKDGDLIAGNGKGFAIRETADSMNSWIGLGSYRGNNAEFSDNSAVIPAQ